MKRIVYLSILASLFVHALLAGPKLVKYTKTKSGLEYAIIKKGKGAKAKNGYRIYVNYITRIKADSVFDSNAERGKPYAFILGQEEVLKGWDEGIALLSEGDSAHFRIPPALAFGERKVGRVLPNTTLFLEVKVVKIEQAFYEHAGKDTIVYPSGLKKIYVSKGINETPKAFNNVKLRFTGYVYSSKGYKRLFQSSLTNSDLAVFQLGAGRLVKGLDEGIATMQIGEKATFIVPPQLGFGPKQQGLIAGNSTLYFDIELLQSIDPFYHSSNTDTIFASSGLKILPFLKKEGLTITSEDVAFIDYTAYFIDSLGHPIIFDNTIERKEPAQLRPGMKLSLPGIEEGLKHMKKGEKATLYIPPEMGFGDRVKSNIPKNSALICDVHVLDSRKYPFFDVTGLDTIKSPSGLAYIQVRKGTGALADTSKVMKVAYTGFLIDSLNHRQIFDASRESGQMLEFILGKGQVIKGFDEGIKGMAVGDARRLIIPYILGYGETGMPEVGIPPKSTLYFDVELVDIKNVETQTK